MADLVSGIARLNPFSKRPIIDDEDKGEAIDERTVAGGGHASRQSAITKSQLRVSRALRSFLAEEGILSAEAAGVDQDEPTQALKELLHQPHIHVPDEVLDRGYPLPDYFISSSHNTYLMAHQLYGESHASAYEAALNTGSRCVEIDAWDNDDNKDEPKVTHGYTLVSNIPFRQVCEVIRHVIDKEAQDARNAAPIVISLENHCSTHGQLRLVQIIKEVLDNRLLSKAVREKGTREQQSGDEHVTLADLENKAVLIVEYHLPNEDDTDSTSDSSEDEEQRAAHRQYREKKKTTNAGSIIPELAELGVYAQSVKPVNNSWYESVLDSAPHHHLINVSETALKSHMPANNAKIAMHNSRHLMRVFPKGTRISSRNLAPVPFWGIGAQICALNWQTFGASSQLNEALFAGSGGYVLKPASLRSGGEGYMDTGGRKKLRLHVAGASDVPLPKDRDDEVKPYLTCTLVHPMDLDNIPQKRKTQPYKSHRLTGFLHKDNPASTDPIWKEVLEWEYDDNELVFLRLLIKSDDSFSRNPLFAVAAVRLMYTVSGWNFIRMLDLKGHETTCTLLVEFEIQNL